ncbi:MAG: DNA-binding protein [archaeon]|nr:DNA-binding protein [archaeon]
MEQAREQRLNELKQKMLEEKQEDTKQVEAEQQLDAAVKPLLSIEARERLNNVKLVNKNLYVTVAQTILMLRQKRQFTGALSDAELKMLLEKFSQHKREIRIKRK